MTVREMAEKLSLELLSGAEENLSREVEDGYCGDLLSWVMGRAPDGGAWITIMSNVNVAAVAHLADVACVILAEGVNPDPQLLERAEKDGLPLYRSEEQAYPLCGKLYALLS